MFKTESDLEALVKSWSDCTLPGKDFTHSAHIAVCGYFVWNNTLADSFLLMKSGLYRFNESVGGTNTDDSGYHETLTRFWCTLLFFKIHRGHYPNCLAAVDSMQTAFAEDSRAEQAYYSFDVLKSREARRRWIPPDIAGPVARECFCW